MATRTGSEGEAVKEVDRGQCYRDAPGPFKTKLKACFCLSLSTCKVKLSLIQLTRFQRTLNSQQCHRQFLVLRKISLCYNSIASNDLSCDYR